MDGGAGRLGDERAACGRAGLLRFAPDADFSGTAALTYQAWDETSGSPGGVANASVNGGATAFSSASETATIDVAPVADAPTFTIAGGGANVTTPEPLTGEFRVNTTTSGDQVYSSMWPP